MKNIELDSTGDMEYGSATMLSICSSVCLFVCRQNAINAIFSQTKQSRACHT